MFHLRPSVAVKQEKSISVMYKRMQVVYKDVVLAVFACPASSSSDQLRMDALRYIATYGYLAEWRKIVQDVGGIKWDADGNTNRPSWEPWMHVTDLTVYHHEQVS